MVSSDVGSGVAKTARPISSATIDEATASPKLLPAPAEPKLLPAPPNANNTALANRPNFYVTPDGTAIPAKGFRAITGTKNVEEALSGEIAPRPNGTYFTFDDITNMSQGDAKGLLQLPGQPSHVAVFDTIQIMESTKVPKMFQNTGLFPEPIADVYPQFGPGGGTQAITDSPIVPAEVLKLPEIGK